MIDTSFKWLQHLIAEEFGVSVDIVGRDTTAEDIDGWDSLSHAILMMAIEKQYGIRFPNEDIFTLANVGALHDRIMELRPTERFSDPTVGSPLSPKECMR